MASTSSFNTRSPTIKRILRESRELTTAPSPDFSAAPLESNLFEWHFTLRGPPSTPYAGGLYHGRIVLPATYPLRPPSFRFLTPSGRFEVNREICLSISGHHEESWQPAWGIRTALVAIRAFMEGDAKGQVGGVDATKEVRERYARESKGWRCPTCGKANHEVADEMERDAAKGEQKEEVVPEELKLGYRDELGKNEGSEEAKSQERSAQTRATSSQPQVQMQTQQPQPQAVESPQEQAAHVAHFSRPPQIHSPGQAGGGMALGSQVPPQPTRTVAPPGVIRPARRREDETILNRLDLAIAVFAAALAYMIVRKIASWTA